MGRILIVDDVPTNRLRLEKFVLSLGHECIAASDGLRALAVLEDNPRIACVVTDCQMPNMDGPELIGKIRERGWNLPVFVYSAYRTVHEVDDLLLHGATCFLSYPVEREMLKEYVNRYLVPGDPVKESR